MVMVFGLCISYKFSIQANNEQIQMNSISVSILKHLIFLYHINMSGVNCCIWVLLHSSVAVA